MVSISVLFFFLSCGAAAAAVTSTDHHSAGGVASGWYLASNLQLRACATLRMRDSTFGSVAAGAATNTTDYSAGGGGGGGGGSGWDLSSNFRLRAWASDLTLAFRRVPQPPVHSDSPFSLAPGGLKRAVTAILVALVSFEILTLGQTVLILFVIFRRSLGVRCLKKKFG